ncbi:hypothetical protein LTR50_000779 [Elasticomyces elasticus]|nr:hypothetical protein LTR50_000779 [Elasticomyces elasticus]
MPTPIPAPVAAKPTRTLFDPWNSSSTGHQRAENRLSGSTSWRDSRSLKLGEQFRAGHGGGKRLYDTVGAGSEGFGKDGRMENGGWERGARGLRKGGQLSLWESMGAKSRKIGIARGVDEKEDVQTEEPVKSEVVTQDDEATRGTSLQDEEDNAPAIPLPPQIFSNLTIYINGSTAPTISDHKLKRLLSAHGARLSIALGRRSVTHVILGHPNGSAGGAGGGLSGSKMQKEIARVRGKGVKFVSGEWVIESVRRGKRLPEANFKALRLAPKGVRSVMGMFEKTAG